MGGNRSCTCTIAPQRFRPLRALHVSSQRTSVMHIFPVRRHREVQQEFDRELKLGHLSERALRPPVPRFQRARKHVDP